MSSSIRRSAVLTTLLASLLVYAAPAGASAPAAVVPAAPIALPATIEPLAPYQPQQFCDPVNQPGVVAFAKLLTATYRDTSIVSISRACDAQTGVSEHKEGRALDWGVYYKNAKQTAEVRAVFAWLFASDAQGNKDAMLRRLGIMYIIWNKRIWGAWDQQWEPYSCSGVTACHQDHVHFSFDWSGAEKRTSFWSGKVSAPMDPPLFVYNTTAFSQVVPLTSERNVVTQTAFAVKKGVKYRVTVTGTYRDTSKHLADAECVTTDGKTWTATNAQLTLGTYHFWAPAAGRGRCDAATHTYSRTLTFPATATLPITVGNLNPFQGAGTLQITVQALN